MTGYVRLDLTNRSHAEYERLGERLLACVREFAVIPFEGRLEDCWHWQLSEGAEIPPGNPDKDTRAFHAVQHQKTQWVATAARSLSSKVFVWLDWGILHVPGITEDVVRRFLERCRTDAPTDRIGMASIWGDAVPLSDWSLVDWHCAGGVFTVPSNLAGWWHGEVVKSATALRERGRVTWEVNDWAEACKRNRDKVKPWPCDHNATLLENGP